ncbi:hypothetical protein ASA1KI_07320 [Opitutales bacterium ASA1]|nr:hypothetical protein ASA1KI_07320 [Opitutales bacterium ASA1]
MRSHPFDRTAQTRLEQERPDFLEKVKLDAEKHGKYALVSGFIEDVPEFVNFPKLTPASFHPLLGANMLEEDWNRMGIELAIAKFELMVSKVDPSLLRARRLPVTPPR